MKFLPEKSSVRYMFFSLILIVLGICGALIILEEGKLITSIILILGFGLAIYLSYYLLMIMTLKYEVSEKGLSINSAFNLTNFFIDWKDINSYHESITLLEFDSILLRNKRFAFGKVFNHNNHELNRFFITNNKKAIFLHTNKGTFGISPEDKDGFIRNLNIRNIHQSKDRNKINYTLFDLEGNQEAKSIVRYIAVIVSFIILSTILLSAFSLIPEVLNISLPYFSYIRLQAKAAYIRDIVMVSIMISALTALFYAFLRVLVLVENRYYFKLMYIPLLLSIICLIYHLSIIGRIFI